MKGNKKRSKESTLSSRERSLQKKEGKHKGELHLPHPTKEKEKEEKKKREQKFNGFGG